MADSSQIAPQARGLWEAFGAQRDLKMRASLIEHYLPLARMIAARVYGLRIDPLSSFEDYLQYARVGLMESIDRFDLSRGVPFESYAARRIRGAILNGLAQQSESAAQRRFWRATLKQRTESLVEQHGGRPERASLQNLIDITIGLALGFALDDSGSDPIDEAPHANPYAATELDQFAQRVRSLVEALPEREREVIKEHYFNRLEFQELATRYGISKGRVSQMHAKALSRLREKLEERPRLNRKL